MGVAVSVGNGYALLVGPDFSNEEPAAFGYARTFTIAPIQPVPLPSGLALMLGALAVGGVVARRRAA